ncbi:MFS general substrate transporter [Mycena sanguinolenta]|uniref:MFS general substrate transporter n=1 Tax=Mycena sanguinolenta TaxID=230812 RepID=A0A8H6YHJ8_9AGAR|nr:MFS general substrate transporter [Mycena sanguinolenta]
MSCDDERVPLLDPAPSTPANRKWLRNYSGATLIVPLALLCRIATLLPTTTTFYILQQFICRQYYRAHDPARIPPDGHMSDELCSLPAIDENYAAFIAIVALMDGIGSLGGYAALSFLAARLGRRAAMATILGIGLGADLALIFSTLVAPWLEVPLFALWLISSSFSQANLIAFVANIYLVDLVHEDDRTSALSSLTGWAVLGSVISFSIGGTITTRGGNGSSTCGSFSPESFPKAKRDALRAERQREQASRDGRWGILSRIAAVLAPLKLLKPAPDPQTGRQNWRLLICGVHMFLVGLGGGYAVASLVTIITSLYQYKPEETGYMLTALSGASMLVLTFAIPFLIRVLRPLYRRSSAQSATAGEAEGVEATDRLDVHIAVASLVIEATAYVTFAYMRTRATQLAAVIVVGCAAGYAPTVRSLVAASVEPLRQGETLGAVEMLMGLGLFLSPSSNGQHPFRNHRVRASDGLFRPNRHRRFCSRTFTARSGC